MSLSSNGQFGGGSVGDRPAVVAGAFYPASKDQLRSDVESYFQEAGKVLERSPLAVIVPHAGYVFSGQVAAAAYKQIDREARFKHVFLIGSSHTMFFNGASVYTHGDFITPLGRVKVDNLANDLVQQDDVFTDDKKPHEREHSLEVQLPFLQYWLNNEFSIVPIIIGGESQSTSAKVAEALAPYLTEDNLFVISSDFSHYPTYSNAHLVDDDMAHAIASNSARQFMHVKMKRENSGMDDLATAMCGWTSGLALLKITETRSDVEYKTIIYQNSGDSPYGDKDRVVGYWAIAAVKRQSNPDGFILTDADKKQLLGIARSQISAHLKDESSIFVDENSLSPGLLAPAGAFVTLRSNGALRGCIGNFSTSTPLYKVVMSMAVASATEDTRFDRVTIDEMDNIDIEISVLTPMRRIYAAEEFIPGKHGIYIRKGNRSGTFLPQVGVETGWSREELLGHCARDKAFIGWDGWMDSDVELYVYEAIVFSEI
ncbi:MAG: AmmeMemoRadiSam system protein B [Bacteroidales bacterium]|nr:AmmeMemoRadiSam system protein B [Bacteroidales bacterium]